MGTDDTKSELDVRIFPSLSGELRYGKEVAYGWSVRIFRWLSDWSDAGPYERVPEIDAGPPTSGRLVADLDEFEGRTTTGGKTRNVFREKEFAFRCELDVTGWCPRWFESALVEVAPPFQGSLPRGREYTYRLRVRAFHENGDQPGEASLTFANLPTWCVWDAELQRPGGIEKIVDGRRIVNGIRSVIIPADWTGEGRAGFVHAVGTFHVAVYDATGTKLWARDDDAGVPVYNSTATRAFDINADGRDEVITMCGKPPEGRIRILEGTTGRVLREAPWPRSGEDVNRWHHGGNAGHSAYSYDAKVYIANFRGLPQPRDLVLQTGDENRTVYSALTDDLELLWEFDLRAQREKDGGAGAHCPVIYDIDGDGRDEMLAGTYMLDHNGALLWTIPFLPAFHDDSGDGHIDCADIGPVGPDDRTVVAFANNCVTADACTGRVLWRGESDHGQWAYIRKVRPDLPGNQVVFMDKLGPQKLFDGAGNELAWPASNPGQLGDWNGDGNAQEVIGNLVTDIHGRVIGIGTGIEDPLRELLGVGAAEPCPLVSPSVTATFTHQLGLNLTRVQAFSGIPIHPPRGRKLAIPRHIYNRVD